jgi:hypothetical protein
MADLIRKLCEVRVLEKRKDGGRIVINTASVDRDRDRVMPSGALVENYLRNPIVQWGHNYRDPWATVGKTTLLEKEVGGLIAEFELRPAANDQDPQNIIRLLWDGEWIRTSSIGFIPREGKPNELGGMDFSSWELLEWSLVPIPSNQEALRLAVTGISDDWESLIPPPISELTQKRGRVLSAKNQERIESARDALNEVLAQLQETPESGTETEGQGAESIRQSGISAEDERGLAQDLRLLINLVKGV